MVRKGLREMFAAARFVCKEAENGAQAVEQAQNLRPDLVVMDFSMPIMNGLEATSVFKRRFPITPIIMLTMFATKQFAKLAVAAGVTEVISKEKAASDPLTKVEALLFVKRYALGTLV
jgi:two-component system nitrate/nitrite response regulator NarL